MKANKKSRWKKIRLLFLDLLCRQTKQGGGYATPLGIGVFGQVFLYNSICTTTEKQHKMKEIDRWTDRQTESIPKNQSETVTEHAASFHSTTSQEFLC